MTIAQSHTPTSVWIETGTKSLRTFRKPDDLAALSRVCGLKCANPSQSQQ
ncbi:MAG: hypothetical protein ACXAC5_00635 [Promethearchaeota archaeon]